MDTYEKKYKEANDKVAARFGINVAKEIFTDLYESEDEKIRKTLVEFFTDWGKSRSHCWSVSIPKILAWLEKQGEQKPAWSEEDEEILRTIISDGIRGAEFDMLQIGWLKSLKERYTWKPSDEQMQCLLSEVEAWTKGCPKQKALESLYNDLKKLTE